VSFSVLFMCTVLLPPGGYPIAVKYIVTYHAISYNNTGTEGRGYRTGLPCTNSVL